MGILNLRVTYKRAKVPVLEAVTFKKPKRTLRDIRSLKGVDECVIIQTCHRVEVYIVSSSAEDVETSIIQYWLKESHVEESELAAVSEKDYDLGALTHLLRLASGVESMVVGEGQVLGQVRDAYLEAKEAETVGPILDAAFLKAVNVGRSVRVKTDINRGAVSIGSAAVDLASAELGSLGGKKILVVGAGEIGTLVGKALSERGLSAIFVANRTYERGVRLAQMLGGEAVHLDQLDNLMPKVDIVIVATAAPHYILTKKRLESLLTKRDKNLIIIDLSQPRNVEETVRLVPGVKLFSLDDLKVVADENLKKRLCEVEKAEEIVKDEVVHLRKMVNEARVEPLISAVYKRAEQVRRRELQKALTMLGNLEDGQREVIEDLTHVLIKRVLHSSVMNLRRAAENGEANLMALAQELFK